MIKNRELHNIDYPLFFITIILAIFGLIMVFSSSVVMADVRWQSPYLFVTKQLIWISIGMVCMLLLSNYNYHKFQNITKIFMAVTLFLLVFVLFFGPKMGGARRWFRFGFLSFQPSELAKLVMVLSLADYLDRRKSKIKEWRGLWPAFMIISVFCGLIAIEPDLGTPILMVLVGLSLLFVAGASIWHLFIVGISSLPFIILEIFRKPYRIQRVVSFFQSWMDFNSGSYQLTQSILALGSGGVFGKGLAQSQLKIMYLPEPHTDFIFPIIGEELGFLGAIFLIVLFILFSWRGLRIAYKSRDFFGGLLAVGITWMITFQVLINLGVACGLLPTKGMPLPFVSFGGSALVFNMIGVGILLNISKRCIKIK
ncbi:MAG: putative lipid II flippase FtsW [Endomicrobiales bacterium]|nr:putative lipid II flippase FtsW [Endomicrobiales bacterium]